ncbi:hypothetical protein GO491_10560 [Flavobacteriaceae bacterium Ap0902]|nr:hypothetical protein [Flavobacteriaceae bacterium Ap0902]
MKKILFLILLTYGMLSCQKQEQYKHPYSFYYWKSVLDLTEKEKNVLAQSTGEDLYVRFFDVDKINRKFEPVASAIKKEGFDTRKNIIPVIFITNRTFLNIEPEELTFLAKNINRVIESKVKSFGFNPTDEIQIDCDWTAGTKKDYFKFLEILKEESRKTITSTLRLHQVKYKEKSGIPPVDKVYLMCYSTSSPLENSNKNSILDLGILQNYLAALEKYPIKNITVALPIYSWGIIENHLGKHKLINGLNVSDIDCPNFKKINTFEAEIMEDGFYFGFYLNKGFKIKIEQISEETLQESIDWLENKIQAFPIVYYQLDEKFISDRDFLKH